jgi:hypothetical protein
MPTKSGEPAMKNEKSATRFDRPCGKSANESSLSLDVGPNVAPAGSLSAVSRELGSLKDSLGFIDSIIIDRRINREAKRALAEGYLQLIEAKRQELVAKITIGLSDSKKKLLVESLRLSGVIDREMADLSAEFSRVILDGATATNLVLAVEERRKLDEIEIAYGAGKLTESRYAQLRAAATGAADHLMAIVRDNAAQIIQSHLGQVTMALELFRERLINRGF